MFLNFDLIIVKFRKYTKYKIQDTKYYLWKEVNNMKNENMGGNSAAAAAQEARKRAAKDAKPGTVSHEMAFERRFAEVRREQRDRAPKPWQGNL